MRRSFLVVALTALFVGMVPATSISAQVDAQAVPNNVHFVVGQGVGAPSPTYICVDDVVVATITPATTGPAAAANVEVAPGNHKFTAAAANDCTTGAVDEIVDLGGGLEYSAIFRGLAPGSGWLVEVDDSSVTPLGKARFIFRHSVFGVGDVTPCLNGAEISDPVSFNSAAVVEVDAGQDVPFALSGLAPGDCSVPVADFDLAAGTAFVANAVNQGKAFTLDGRVIVTGQERAANTAAIAAFCTVLNPDLGAFSDGLKTLLTPASVTDPSLVSVDALTALIKSGAATIQQGDKTVPESVKPQWEVVTEGLRSLIAGIETAGYNWAVVPQPQRQKIVDGLNSTEPDPEVDAATEVLTAFYLGKCIPTAGPSFTG